MARGNKILLISQRRVHKRLRAAGWEKPEKEIYKLFANHHERVPHLIPHENDHRPAKNGKAVWYHYDSAIPLTAVQAEKIIADKLASLLHL